MPKPLSKARPLDVAGRGELREFGGQASDETAARAANTRHWAGNRGREMRGFVVSVP